MPGKILIVDDQFGIRILLNEVLHKEGYETFQAANGIQALEVLNNHSPDLVLLDMKIPGMDGIEILKRMKVVDPDIRVIIMTAYGELDMIQEAKDLGAMTHFAKPFDIDDIRKAVREYLPIQSS
ncbi:MULTISPECIES: response regulator [Bacillales]|jgi:two-component system response regulator (stage 0 sporulation protein F)|uniref:Response regulator n=4 Tax=Peribacillus TaxID=2675229 RepID=A0A098F5S9_9BACI|nr:MULTISPECIES: response regulator [Bacillales]KOR81124.1 chemotaxis protein CheY [Bacillus sp. FJAT-21352]KOR85196.1 chemotaxis protein CheY [Bacillus sp. FJAT-22058]KRF50881.1 two-component system response regulator [Bacillus sp. Soil745]MBD8137878.1 response regulator [Bacillus sp. CFBP 13597]MBL3642554.1 response regulator [Bacillus sp. RHFB]MBT2604109.1 response regulator [Bacillus sp. ISL-53]MBT2670275.1 response regulator [Streptomyces sp. ISL-14]MCD1160650.1 response regulator [Per